MAVYGTQDLEEREQAIADFSLGKFEILSTKPILCGSGCNFQRFCHSHLYLGIGFKFNDFIQAVHRILRFLQQHEVEIHLIYASSEKGVLKRLMEKWERHKVQVQKMAQIIAEYGLSELALAQAVGYDSAGTVEFVAGQDKSFYFLEMNTRLQVEHPVTELITGVDLVEQMIRVAAGEALAIKQGDVKLRGWAVESRVYAEDPTRNFLPSTGKLVHLRLPVEDAHVRVDTGVREGDTVTPFYDPMIAKVIVHGHDRQEAIARMRRTLEMTVVDGIKTTIPLHQALLDDPELYTRDPGKFAKASDMFAAIETELAAAEEEWLELEIRRETLEG